MLKLTSNIPAMDCKIKEKATEQTFTLFYVFCEVMPHHRHHLTVRPHWTNAASDHRAAITRENKISFNTQAK
jgi:hypothetical protein